MIMWDKVIMSKEDAVFDEAIENRYILFNDDRSILYSLLSCVRCSDKEVTISFRYQIQPTVGFQRDYVFPDVLKVRVTEERRHYLYSFWLVLCLGGSLLGGVGSSSLLHTEQSLKRWGPHTSLSRIPRSLAGLFFLSSANS